jgi:hypothetical protein
MFTYTQQQSSFRQGELGDGLSEKRQLEIFHNSLQVAENANINLQGNIFNRGGFRYLFDAPLTDGLWHYNTVVWSFRNPANVLIVRAIIFSENLATVYNVDEEGKIIPNALCSFATNKSARLMQKTHCSPIEKDGNHSVKALLFTNRTVKPFLLTFSGNAERAEEFNITDATLYNIPKHQFVRDDRTGAQLGTGVLNIQQRHSQYNIVATNGAFTTGLCNDYKDLVVRIKPMGEFRILERVDDNTLACTLTKDLGNAENIRAEDFVLELGWEPIVSNERGWFECGAVHDNRLFLANTRDLPNALVASTTEFKLDFDLGSMQDDDACYTLIPTGLTDEIVNLVGGSTLHIFTKNSVYVLASGGGAVVPSTFDTTKISQGSGSDTYTDAPQTQSGGVVYIDSSLEKLFYIAYDRNSESYSPTALNLILPDGLIKQSADTYSLVLVNYGKDLGECVFFINERLEIVRGLLTLEEDAIPCFTHYRFPDTFQPIKLFAIKKNLYCIFHETQSDKNFVTVLDDAAYLDAALQLTLDDKGIGRLPDNYPNVHVLTWVDLESGKNGIVELDYEQQFVIPQAEGHTIQIGRPYTFFMVTQERSGNPKEVPNTQGYRKHLARLYVSVNQATRLRVGCSGNKDDNQFQYQELCRANMLAPVNTINPRGSWKGWYDELLLFFKQDVPGKIFIKSYTVTVNTSAPYGEN